MTEQRYDIIIVGTGAGGGTLAYRLAPSGKKILLLERGDYLPREKDNWRSHTVFVDNKYKAQETWYDHQGKAFHPGIHYYVGGNTKFYGAVLLRMRQEDFGEVRHQDGVSPAWPLNYDDFAPYYRQAEKLYHVHGQRGSDPTEPPETEPYPYPPLSHETRIQKLYDDLTRSGYQPFPLPIGIKLDEHDRPNSPCIRCDTCDGFPCLVDAKADAHITCVKPALAHPNVTLLTNSFVERLNTSPSGREVTGVVVRRRDASEAVYRGAIVVVAAGAINSAALLLRSADAKHPKGLGNGSDVVGRYYMFHNNSALLALSKTPNDTQFQKTLGLNDFYFGADDYQFPLGHIQMLGKTDAEMFKGETHGLVPGIALEQLARHSLDFWLTTEDLPRFDNRITVNQDGIHIHYTDTNVEPHKRLTDKLKRLLKLAQCDTNLIPRTTYFGKRIPVAGTGHQCGTVRFGADPATSALDVNCKSHEVDNLYVVDSSFFVSSSAVNPTLTIIANALRVGDHLLERMG